MGQRIKTFDSTGVAPNGRLFAGDLNAMEDQYADQTNLSQSVSVGLIALGEAGLQVLRYGPGEARITGAVRTDGIMRGLGGLYAGAFTTTQRDAIPAGLRPYGLVILNTTTNRLELNKGTDPAPAWAGLSADIIKASGAPPAASPSNANTIYFRTDLNGGTLYYSDGTVWTQLARGLTQSIGAVDLAANSVTAAKLGVSIPDPMVALGLMMIEGVLPYNGTTNGTPQTQSFAPAAGGGFNFQVAAGRALIQGDDAAAQGMYLFTSPGAISVTLTATAPANPRLDVIALQFNDQENGFTARNPQGATLVQAQGTADPTASLANRVGAPALPPSSLWIADYLMRPGDGAIVVGQIGDKRILAGPGIWGEDNHRYRLGVDSAGALIIHQVI